jgi:hypothetical protein
VRFSGWLISSDQTSGVYSKVDIYRDITLLLRPRPAPPAVTLKSAEEKAGAAVY